jgi:hypothetical protein
MQKTDAKISQNYIAKALPLHTCGNCVNTKTDVIPERKTVKLRCGVGHFAIKLAGVCDDWEQRPE